MTQKNECGKTRIVVDWSDLTDEERKTSSSAYWYEND